MWTLLLAVAAAADLAIVHATALPISGPPIADATLLVTGGKIEALGAGLPVPPGFESQMRDDAIGLSRLRVLPARGRGLARQQ